MTNKVWDYIIVGGGSAGCVLANRLSAEPSRSVLLLEAGWGGLDRTPLVQAPAGSLYIATSTLFAWKYPYQPDPTRANRTDGTIAGKLLGGGSSINGTMFIRGAADDYDDWARLGNDGWGYRDVLPFFKKLERTAIGAEEYHGRGGPLGVEYARPMLDISHRFIEAAIESGIPYNSDINGECLQGVSRTPCSIFAGTRQSTARVYLRPAMKRRNLKVVTRALARKILFDGKEAVGVEYDSNGRTEVAKASKEIILSAGAIRSPQILLLSGIGPAEQMSRFRLPLVHELRGVGHNYMDHLAAHMAFKVSLPTWCREASLGRQASHILKWVLRKDGPADTGFSQAVAFVRSSEALKNPDIQLCFMPFSLVPGDSPTGSYRKLTVPRKYGDMIMVYVSECKPESRGWLTLASTRILDPPLVYPNYLSSPKTLGKIVTGIEIVRRIMAASPIGPHVKAEVRPGSDARSTDALQEWIRQEAGTMAHSSGTCKMGHDDSAVVDEKLRVRGVRKLRVVDASIMPTIPSGNINAPVIMIAEKASDEILCSTERP